MVVYHGSYIEIQNPDLDHSRENVDFGKGFYTTPFYEQACFRTKKAIECLKFEGSDIL